MSKTTDKKIIGLRELREHTDDYIQAIKQGREYTVVKKGIPVFKIVPADEWGDEGLWETVVDFTELDPKGVAISDMKTVLDSLLAD